MAYPTNYNGSLKPNEIYGAIYNMIISQQVFADNLKFNEDFINRVDGGLYGDTKLYYSTDALPVFDWGADAEATKLLELNRPEDPQCQSITLDVFKQIRLSLDNYLTKRAWMGEGAFSSFNSIMLSWMRDTKKMYDRSLNKVAKGTIETNEGSQEVEVTLPTVTGDKEAENRLQAQTISTKVADIFTALNDEGRDYNDYQNMRSYDKGDFDIIWNAAYANKITNLDLPTIFHKDGLFNFDKTLPAKFFGKIGTVDSSKAQTADGLTIRMLKPGFVTLAEATTIKGKAKKAGDQIFLFAGELIPAKVSIATTTAIVVPFYKEDANIICKIVYKQDFPYMSAFEAGTNFYNSRALTETHYTTFGHNELVHIHNFPLITLRAKAE